MTKPVIHWNVEARFIAINRTASGRYQMAVTVSREEQRRREGKRQAERDAEQRRRTRHRHRGDSYRTTRSMGQAVGCECMWPASTPTIAIQGLGNIARHDDLVDVTGRGR